MTDVNVFMNPRRYEWNFAQLLYITRCERSRFTVTDIEI